MGINNPSREYLWALRMVQDWRRCEGATFHSSLFDAMLMADHFQKAKVAKAFPMEFAAFCAWITAGHTASDGDKFLEGVFCESSTMETSCVADSGIPREFEYPEDKADAE